MDKTDKIVELARKKSVDKEKHVLAVIDELQKQKKKITFYAVQKAAGVSKSYIYNNKKLRALIINMRDDDKIVKLSEETSDTVIAALRVEIREQKKEIRMLRKDQLWEEKYRNLKEENQLLRERIEKLMGKLY